MNTDKKKEFTDLFPTPEVKQGQCDNLNYMSMGLAAFLLFEHRTPICRWSNELGYLKLGNEHTFLSDCEAPEPVHPVVYSPVPPGQGLAEGAAD